MGVKYLATFTSREKINGKFVQKCNMKNEDEHVVQVSA